MTNTSIWARLFFEKSVPAFATVAINIFMVNAIITSGIKGWAVLSSIVLMGLFNSALLYRQKNVIKMFFSKSDEDLMISYQNLNRAIFSVCSGIGLASAAMHNISGGSLILSIFSAMVAAGLILIWGSVFASIKNFERKN
jgi:hypothetical protein